jgi:hypothetical protein
LQCDQSGARIAPRRRDPRAGDAWEDGGPVSKANVQEPSPFDAAWRTIDGLKVRYATGGKAREKVVLFSPWPEQLPHARLDVLEAGHCVWEERAAEFEAIVTQWVSGGFEQHG